MDEIATYRVYDANDGMLYSSNNTGTARMNMACRSPIEWLACVQGQ